MQNILTSLVEVRTQTRQLLDTQPVENGPRLQTIALGAAVVAVPVVVVIKVVRWWKKMTKNKDIILQLPHRKHHWLLGSLYDFPGTEGEVNTIYFKGLANEFPEVYVYSYGPVPTVVATGPETAKIVMKTASPKAFFYDFLMDWLGEGLLTSRGKKWFRNRRLLTPAFHFDVLKPYIKIKNEAADTFITNLQKSMDEEGRVEVYQLASMCTLDVMLKCAFSYKEPVQESTAQNTYIDAILRVAKTATQRMLSLGLYPDVIFYSLLRGQKWKRDVTYVQNICNKVIRERKEELDNQKGAPQKKFPDFLDILLLARDENGQGLTDLEIREEVDTFLFEGHDTTASGVSWALHTLARHPAEQQRARREVTELLADRNPPHITWVDISKMPYLAMCIKECLRLNPPVPFVGRCTESEVTIKGVGLPPDTQIGISIYGLHHNIKVWGEDCEDFKPERFTHANMEKMDPFAYLPFSAGPRNCIGQHFAMHELKIIIARILHRFELSLDERFHDEPTSELILRSTNGIHLKLKTIQN